ncbi:MAG: hypothetical protein IPH77_16410 [Ignavibacteria bacterium]|nr:hypothetical protein [Ignavibacteria bacterium]
MSAGIAVAAVICAPTTTPWKLATFVKTGLLVDVFAVVPNTPHDDVFLNFKKCF